MRGAAEVLALSLQVAELMLMPEMGQGPQRMGQAAVQAGLQLLGLLAKPVGLGCLFGGWASSAAPEGGEAWYRPSAISLYCGTDKRGHYTAAIKCPHSGLWWHLNDGIKGEVGSLADLISYCQRGNWIPEVVWCLPAH